MRFIFQKKITCVIGMEAGTPDKETREKELHEKYDSQFDRFIVTIHPKGLPGDIPGKEIFIFRIT